MNRKRPVFARLFRAYVRMRMRGSFDAVRVRGLEGLVERLQHGPLIVAANHASWWDALFLVLLDGVEGIDAHCLMDAQNLRQLPFFAWLGAVPLERSRARRAKEDLDRAAELLDRPGRVLIVFPQGRQVPPHLPLRFASGVLHLARKTGVPVVPMALRYDYREEPVPEMNVSIGPPIDAANGEGHALRRLEAVVGEQLAVIDRHLESDDPSFVRWVGAPRRRVSGAARLLAWVARERTQHVS